jgi:hypothetical protein
MNNFNIKSVNDINLETLINNGLIISILMPVIVGIISTLSTNLLRILINILSIIFNIVYFIFENIQYKFIKYFNLEYNAILINLSNEENADTKNFIQNVDINIIKNAINWYINKNCNINITQLISAKISINNYSDKNNKTQFNKFIDNTTTDKIKQLKADKSSTE